MIQSLFYLDFFLLNFLRMFYFRDFILHYFHYIACITILSTTFWELPNKVSNPHTIPVFLSFEGLCPKFVFHSLNHSKVLESSFWLGRFINTKWCYSAHKCFQTVLCWTNARYCFGACKKKGLVGMPWGKSCLCLFFSTQKACWTYMCLCLLSISWKFSGGCWWEPVKGERTRQTSTHSFRWLQAAWSRRARRQDTLGRRCSLARGFSGRRTASKGGHLVTTVR